MIQRSQPNPFHYMGDETTARPCGRVRVLHRIDHALGRLDAFTMRCLKAIGRAFLDGFAAYGAAMHGYSHPVHAEPPAAPPTRAPIWPDLSATWLQLSPREEDGCETAPLPSCMSHHSVASKKHQDIGVA